MSEGIYPVEEIKADWSKKPSPWHTEEPVRMTNRQLAEWASKRLGEIKNGKTVGVCVHYDEANENYPPDPTVRIRYWDSDEWVMPTVDIYNRDCKGKVDDKAEI